MKKRAKRAKTLAVKMRFNISRDASGGYLHLPEVSSSKALVPGLCETPSIPRRILEFGGNGTVTMTFKRGTR